MSMSAAYDPATATVPEVPYVPDAALPRRSAPGLLLAGIVALVIAAWGGIVPYVGPTFGYGATGTGAWTWNYSHLVLGLAPGAAAEHVAIDIAAEKIAAGDGHDGCRHQRAHADGGKGDAGEPVGKHGKEQRGHREIVAEAGEAVLEGGHRLHARRHRHEAQKRHQREREGINGKDDGIFFHHPPARG